jgi:hypothetical protein
MNTVKNLGLSALLLGVSSAWAQQAPPADAPAIRPDAAQEAASPSAASKASKSTAQSEAGEPRANTSEPRSDAVEHAPAPAPAARPASSANPKAGNPKSPTAADKLQLGTATVTGDREQPKVMYVVPWKRADIGDAEGKPMNSLVDEILSPVDRDVFKREVRYYQTVKSEASQNGAPPAGEQVEK